MSSDSYSHLEAKVCESHLQANNCHERNKRGIASNMLVYLLPSPSGLTVKDEKDDPTRTRRAGRYGQRMGGVRTIAEGRKHDRGAIRATIPQPVSQVPQGSGSQERRQSHTERPREGEASRNEGSSLIYRPAEKFVWFSIPPYGKAQTNFSANLTVTRSSRYLKSRNEQKQLLWTHEGNGRKCTERRPRSPP